MTSVLAEVVLFDLDGVLVDSTPTFRRHWYRWAAEHGLDGPATFDVGQGIQTADHIRIVAPHLDAAREAERFERLEVEDAEGVEAIPGARELVASVPEERWAVVTSSIRPLALARLRSAGLPIPRVLVSAEEIARGKPAPDGYLEAARALGCPIEKAVVVEDTPPGVDAGKAAGARVVAVATTYRREQLARADLIVESPVQLKVRPLDGLGIEVTASE